MTVSATIVGDHAALLGIPVLKSPKLRGDAEFLSELAALDPDALLAASYGQILPKSVLDLTPWPLNVHPSALPKLRGASPVRTALLQGLKQTECCIMRMTPRLDDGDVLLRQPLDIPRDWNYDKLETELGDLGGLLAVSALDLCAVGAAQPVPQDESQATFCSTYTREDTWIDWKRSADELHNFVRAWDPDIGALTQLDGKRLKVWVAQAPSPAEISTQAGAPVPPGPGSIIAVARDSITVACGSGALKLLEVQPENKRRMDVADFLAGHRLEVGTKLG
jgi:methionyl-tRNA formyltransferase